MLARNPGKLLIMKGDPRLHKMPVKPTLIDYFKSRFTSTAHLLQSAALAKKAGHSEKVILACLLHDVAVSGFIRCDHGYWGAQMIEPYVDEEISWAVRAHQALRFFPDESVGYQYPEAYTKWFGPDFKPEPYVVGEYERARAHKYYMTGRLITLNDLYSSTPTRRSTSMTSRTSSAVISSSPKKASASTTARPRICGAPCCGRRGFCKFR